MPHLKFLWNGEVNAAGESERSKKETETKEMGKEHQRMDKNGVWKFPEGSRRQGMMQRY